MKSVCIGLGALVLIALAAGLLESTFSVSSAEHYSGDSKSVRLGVMKDSSRE